MMFTRLQIIVWIRHERSLGPCLFQQVLPCRLSVGDFCASRFETLFIHKTKNQTFESLQVNCVHFIYSYQRWISEFGKLFKCQRYGNACHRNHYRGHNNQMRTTRQRFVIPIPHDAFGFNSFIYSLPFKTYTRRSCLFRFLYRNEDTTKHLQNECKTTPRLREMKNKFHGIGVSFMRIN